MAIDTTWTDPSTGGALDLAAGDVLTEVVWDKLLSNLKHIGRADGFISYPCNGRLTLSSGEPVPASDQTDKTTLYFTPYQGNLISLYDGSSQWQTYKFTELSLNISGFTAAKPYDIWAYDNSGTVTLDSTVWTNTTTRATALALQDGIYVKTGDPTRRYLGTIYMDAAQKCQDKVAQRFVWNYYNRIPRSLLAKDSTNTWNYTTATWRAANNNTTDGVGRVSIVIGVNESLLDAKYSIAHKNTNLNVMAVVGIGIDSTSAISQLVNNITDTYIASYYLDTYAFYAGYPGVGYHYIQSLEYSSATGTTTWAGDAGATFYASGLICFLSM